MERKECFHFRALCSFMRKGSQGNPLTPKLHCRPRMKVALFPPLPPSSLPHALYTTTTPTPNGPNLLISKTQQKFFPTTSLHIITRALSGKNAKASFKNSRATCFTGPCDLYWKKFWALCPQAYGKKVNYYCKWGGGPGQ